MTKDEIREKLDVIPDDILEKCYVIDLIENHLQLPFTPNITKRYYQNNMEINEATGYLDFMLIFGKHKFNITMT